MAVVYHWKHGWIPLDHMAALSKAKGNHALADKMLSDAPHSNGIQSRQDVAKAVRDLPNVPDSHRAEAVTHLHESAAKHDSMDLVPGSSHARDAQKSHARAALEAQLAAFRARQPKHVSKPIKLSPENTPTTGEIRESQQLYGSGKEFYVQMRAEGKSHAAAMKMAARKFGARPELMHSLGLTE